MRYTVHPPRNRITRSLGALVVAALLATLGLPSAVQAQSIAGDGIRYADATGFTIDWDTNLDQSGDLNWIVRVTKPDGTKMVVNERSTAATTLGAVSDDDALTLGTPTTEDLAYKATDLGTWWFQVDACVAPLDPTPADEAAPTVGTCPMGSLEAGTGVGYTHGVPAAPMNLTANAVPGGVALTWQDMTADRAISGYQYAFEMTAAGMPDWEATTGKGAQVIEADPGEHTFMLRAIGRSDNDTSTTAATLPGAAASVEVMVPVPSPTLPEIALLLLAMLLLGSGAYLIRGRRAPIPA